MSMVIFLRIMLAIELRLLDELSEPFVEMTAASMGFDWRERNCKSNTEEKKKTDSFFNHVRQKSRFICC